MKQYLFTKLIFAGLFLVTVPALVFAQKDKTNDKADKKNLEQIIITRKGDANAKTVIEITGDKVIVNGKEVTDKNGDVTVRRNKFQNNTVRSFSDGSFDFHFDANAHGLTSLIREDSNRAMLGVVTDESDKGAEITEVRDESAAQKAGLKKGDIITRIGDKKIQDAGDVSEAVRAQKPGDKVAITVLRDGKEQKVTAELGKYKGVGLNAFNMAPSRINPPDTYRPNPRIETVPYELKDNMYLFNNRPRLGISIQDTEDGKGVKVLHVQEESNAAKAGVQKDDLITHVNDTAVNSADEVSKIVKESKDKNSVMLKLSRNGKTHNIEVRSPKKLKTTSL
jgi:serine protease Do